ncbi:DUF6357 family protein [Amycolatopsis sp. lyj-108]|uniref:DUF6357 family protein n=1 Tax=Amycolatopsis sp. lyj-108 TaxID=2789286 RepID=UPI00397B7506
MVVMTEVLFAHASPWMPRVIRAAGELRLELAAGANANHDPVSAAVERDPAAVRGGRGPGAATRTAGRRSGIRAPSIPACFPRSRG